MNRVTIRLKFLENGCESEEVDLEDIIFNQHDIEFKFNNYEEDGEIYDNITCPYSDFLWFRDYYQVIVKIKGENNE